MKITAMAPATQSVASDPNTSGAREKRTDRQPRERRHAADHRAEVLPGYRRGFNNRRRQGAADHAGCNPLNNSRSNNAADTSGQHEHQHGGSLQHQSRKYHWPAPDVVGQ
jgi:hypothetical protein